MDEQVFSVPCISFTRFGLFSFTVCVRCLLRILHKNTRKDEVRTTKVVVQWVCRLFENSCVIMFILHHYIVVFFLLLSATFFFSKERRIKAKETINTFIQCLFLPFRHYFFKSFHAKIDANICHATTNIKQTYS